ncbi:unnamed protein product [Euphydryas editha]|uniref:MADF domain-containing protein n=1 Tax=Euphydryas editha TaxID=104508 RepID=A0AAU9UFD2_EUPED|nr:unnamed protein product [Euphydryas editha]
MWSNERELQFLECYQTEPVLWNSKDVKHKDKQCIHDAWVRISEHMEKCPVAELKKKRDSLMATYRSHKRRVIASIQSGAAADSVYKPIWFAYKLMDSFLNNIVQCRNTLNTDTQLLALIIKEICCKFFSNLTCILCWSSRYLLQGSDGTCVFNFISP